MNKQLWTPQQISSVRNELSRKFPLVNFSSFTKFELKNIQQNLQFVQSRFNFTQFNKNYVNMFHFLAQSNFVNFDLLLLFLQYEMSCVVLNENLINSQPVILKRQDDRTEFAKFLSTHKGILNGDFLFWYLLRGNLTAAQHIFYDTSDNNPLTPKLNTQISKNMITFPYFNLINPFIKSLFTAQLLSKYTFIFNLLTYIYL